MKNRLLGMLFFCGLVVATTVSAKEPGWSGTIIARGAQREQIEAMNILIARIGRCISTAIRCDASTIAARTLPDVRDVAKVRPPGRALVIARVSAGRIAIRLVFLTHCQSATAGTLRRGSNLAS